MSEVLLHFGAILDLKKFLSMVWGLQAGALPVFIVDGNPPPEKLQVRMERFSRLRNAPMPFPDSQGTSTAELHSRHGAFQKSIDECVVGAPSMY